MIATLLLSGLVLGCGGTPMDQQIPVNRGRGYQRPIDTLGMETPIDARADKIWSVLPAVLTDLGLTVNFREPAAFRTGTCYQRLRLRLGRELLSTFIDCGETVSRPNADRYEIALTVLITVRPTGENRASVFTFVLGVALDASGAASNRLWCYSKGGIEERIRAGIEHHLAEGGGELWSPRIGPE